MHPTVKAYLLVLTILLAGFGRVSAQTLVPPPGWSEGDPISSAALDGVWSLKVPFRFDQQGTVPVTRRTHFPWTASYISFDQQGIIFRRTLGGREPRNAIGVWLLRNDRLELTVFDMTLDLECYIVQPDKIVVAGTCTGGDGAFAVAGVLLRLREGYPIEMEE